MYNLKKVIASICVIAMMLTTVAFGATYSDVAEDSAYYEAVETLNKLGIVKGYEDGTYKPEDGVTRAEMAALIARIQGFGASAEAQIATDFTDVPATHWASGYVASAASMGIINGYGDGKFGPDDNVLFEQAVKMIMATLGYTPYAEYNGGYPGGFIAAAQRYNVTAGVSNATMGTQANRGTVAQLLANAIDTPLMQQTGWTTNGEVEYVINDGKNNNDYKTLMSENLGVVKIRGILAENAYTAIDDSNKTIDTEEDETVVIYVDDAFDTSNKDFSDKDGELRTDCPDTYYVGESDANDFIGKSVIAYVQEVDNEYEIVSIVLDTARNTELSMDLSQFNQIVGNKFEYYKSSTAKTATSVNLDPDAVVVFNNVGGYDLDDIFGNVVEENGATLNGGKITLVDNNDTKGYDVIFVEVAETAVVDDAEEGYVAFKSDTAINALSELEIDEDDTDKIVKVTKDGAEIALADLAEWDVLSIIAADSDASYILAEVVSNEVIGTITSEFKSTTSDGGKGFKIGSEKYDVAAGAYGVTGMAVGDGGKFFIDKYGKIAAFDEDSSLASGVASNYAYVTAVAEDEDILTNKKTAIFQLVTADGVIALNLKATSARLDGKAVNADDDMADLLALEGKLIKYTKNASSDINTITTVDNEDDIEGGMITEKEYEFDAEDARFVGAFGVDADALVFFINDKDAKDSYLGSVAELSDGELYTIMGRYADKKAEEHNIVIVKDDSTKVGKKVGLAVITSVGTSENEDGEQIFAIEAMMNGEELAVDTSYEAYDENKADLTVGDIVKIKLVNNVATVINIVFDFEEDVRAKEGKDLADFALTFANGEYKADGNDEVIEGGQVEAFRDSSTTATINNKEFKLSQAKNIIVIDPNGRKVEVKKGTASSFKYYEALYKSEDVTVTIDGEDFGTVDAEDALDATDYVFARKYDNRTTDIIIVKGPADTKIKAAK